MSLVQRLLRYELNAARSPRVLISAHNVSVWTRAESVRWIRAALHLQSAGAVEPLGSSSTELRSAPRVQHRIPDFC